MVLTPSGAVVESQTAMGGTLFFVATSAHGRGLFGRHGGRHSPRERHRTSATTGLALRADRCGRDSLLHHLRRPDQWLSNLRNLAKRRDSRRNRARETVQNVWRAVPAERHRRPVFPSARRTRPRVVEERRNRRGNDPRQGRDRRGPGRAQREHMDPQLVPRHPPLLSGTSSSSSAARRRRQAPRCGWQTATVRMC